MNKNRKLMLSKKISALFIFIMNELPDSKEICTVADQILKRHRMKRQLIYLCGITAAVSATPNGEISGNMQYGISTAAPEAASGCSTEER